MLWLNRSEFIFRGTRVACGTVGRKILCVVAAIQQSYEVGSCSVGRAPHVRGNIRWIAPQVNFVKLNCDGAVGNLGTSAAIGGVFRNNWGAFLCGFASNIGSGTITEVELKAVLMGAELAHRKGYNRVILETDSLIAVRLINEGCSVLHPVFDLVGDIQEALRRVGETVVVHTLREDNQVADSSAKFGMTLDSGAI